MCVAWYLSQPLDVNPSWSFLLIVVILRVAVFQAGIHQVAIVQSKHGHGL